jgi:hypothetical protein
MAQSTGQSQRNLQEQQAMMIESRRVEERVQETVQGLESTVHRAMDGRVQAD